MLRIGACILKAAIHIPEIHAILPLGFPALEIVDNLIQQSVVDFGCAEDRAASEGGVEGGKDDGGEYCKGSITVS